ncbi:MAG: type VI secretion system tube protein Hcp [Aquisalimonadaceae bacterium]
MAALRLLPRARHCRRAAPCLRARCKARAPWEYISVSLAASTRNDRESSVAEISDLVLIKRMDKASPVLFIEACCGRGKKDVVIHLAKTGTGSGADVYMGYTLRHALITKYQVLASGNGNNRPLERLVISFRTVLVRYTPYSDAGVAMSPIAVGFNAATNMKL